MINIFSVSSASYSDYIDANQFVEVKKNLVRSVPLMIKNDIKKSLTKDRSILLEQYKFPKFLPKTFIEKLEHCQKDGSSFQHVIYKNKNNGNTKSLTLRYCIRYLIGKEKLPTPLIVVPQHEPKFEDSRKESFFSSDHVIDLLDLLTLLMWTTTK